MSQEMTAPRAKVETYVDRTRVPAGEAAPRFALLLLHAPEAGEGSVHPPLNLSIVIDRSGSMSGDKLGFAKDAARHALRLLHEPDRVSIILYDDEVKVLAPGQTVTAGVRDDLTRRLREVRSGGQTDLHGGWAAGCSQVREGQDAGLLNRVLLLTDGLANVGICDQEDVVTHVKAQHQAGISTTTFGVGVDFNQFLLEGMADNGGGHFYFIERPEQISDYFKNELGEMVTVTARNVVLEIGMPGGATLDLLNDLPHEVVGQTWRIPLGDLSSGDERTLALRVGLPANEQGAQLTLPIVLTYTDAEGQPVALDGLGCHFLYASAGACEEQPINEMVLEEGGRRFIERAMKQALAHLYNGEEREALDFLQEAMAYVRKMLPEQLAERLVGELQEMVLGTTQGRYRGNTMDAKMLHHLIHRSQRSRKM